MHHIVPSSMAKLSRYILAFLLAGLLVSCSGDNLYEYGFEDLSGKRDFVIQVIVIPEDASKDFEFKTVFFETNGYGEILKTSPTFYNSGDFRIIRNAVKEYKKVGVTFVPRENISRIEVKIYDILFDDTIVLWRGFDEINKEITITYDFESSKEEVIRN